MKNEYTIRQIEGTNPFKDILTPLVNREGYSKNNIPIFFIRHIGGNNLLMDEFYNELYVFDKKLSKGKIPYIKMDKSIDLPSNDEIKLVTNWISKGRPLQNRNLYEAVVSQVINSTVLNIFQVKAQQEMIVPAFEKVMNLYMKTERNINESKLENFVVKLIVWLHRYNKTLFTQDKEMPKILFYGKIKNHEVYFLTLLSLIGCDVCYVSTDKMDDNCFEIIHKEMGYSQKIEAPDSFSNVPFPITEKLMPKSTVAYKASKELSQTLFNGEIGIFKARQFEGGYTKATPLKTTYDELKILWNEEARIRPEFKVEDDTVYVPSIFAKINGTHENLSEYWKDIQELRKSENTVFYESIPFSKVNYTKQELYSSAFLFDKDGLVNQNELFKSQLYKLKYLKTSLQIYIVEKINELLRSNLFIEPSNDEFRLKVLMTIITMDSSLLRLLEVFDFTGKIPKIIIFDGNKEIFSEEDSILLAFFYLVGIDVVIFTPSNYANIENWIPIQYYSMHQLPKVQFDLTYKKEGIEKLKNELSFPFKLNEGVDGRVVATGIVALITLILITIF